MSGDTSRENGKKGGRPKNVSTIKAEEARNILAQMVFDEITPIAKKLIEKAKNGDVQAIKELWDRAFGKAPQAITGLNGGPLKLLFDQAFNASPSETETDSK